jgi:ribosomal protein L32
MRVCINRERNVAMLLVVTISMLAAVMGGAGCAPSQPATSSHNADNGSTAPSRLAVCIPSDVEVSKPLAEYSPMPTAQGACSQTALDGLFGACFVPSGNCTAWKMANSTCAQCVFTPDSATVQGPFITRKNAIPKANQRGCLDSLAPGCGTAYESVTACTHAACDSNAECKSATSAQRAACRQAAMQSSCKPLMLQFSEKCGEGGLANKRVCFPPSSDEASMRDYITGLARRACGS